MPIGLVGLSTSTDVVFILDSSEVVSGKPFEKMKKYISEVTKDFKLSKDNVRVGVINLGEKVSMPLPLNKDISSQEQFTELLSGINAIGGKRNLAAAFKMARNVFVANDRSSGKALIAVLGDKIVVNTEVESLIRDLERSDVSTGLVSIDNSRVPERTKNIAGVDDYFLQLNDSTQLPKAIDFVSRLMGDISSKY